MRPHPRDLLLHLLGYAAPHAVAAIALATLAIVQFRPGGEAFSAIEAVQIRLFVVAVLLVFGGAGYLVPLLLTFALRPRPGASLIPGLFGGVAVVALAGAGQVARMEQAFGLSSFLAAALLGFVVGLAMTALVFVRALLVAKRRRAH